MLNYTVEQNKRLVELYPYLKPTDVWTGEELEDYDFSYINGEYDLPAAWHKLFLVYCKEIRPHLIASNKLTNFRFSQLKEKYGIMRMYNFGSCASVEEITCLYERFSKFICYACGNFSSLETAGWIGFFCAECVPDYSVVHELRTQKCLVIEKYVEGTSYKVYYSYKNLRKTYIDILHMSNEEFYKYITEVE